MKRILIALITLVFLTGCAGMELKDDAVGNSIGYFSGKGVGVAINEGVSEDTVKSIEANYDAFMVRNAGNEMVSPEEVMALFNSSVGILTLEVADPHGLLSDLTFLISQFGGELVNVPGENPVLSGVQPIPYRIFQNFEFGYDSGKRIAQQM